MVEKGYWICYRIHQHISPTVAHEWVQLVVDSISEDMRLHDKAREEFNQFDKQRTHKLDLPDEVFAQLIEDQTKVIMFAEVEPNYVYDLIDEAVVPERASEPNRLLVILIGGAAGSTDSNFIVGKGTMVGGMGNRERAI